MSPSSSEMTYSLMDALKSTFGYNSNELASVMSKSDLFAFDCHYWIYLMTYLQKGVEIKAFNVHFGAL